MDERARQLVFEAIKGAHEGALEALRQDLETLSPECHLPVVESIEALRACLLHQLEGRLSAQAAGERMAALIFGHACPQTVAVLERYARILQDRLMASRDRLTATPRRREN